VARSLRGRSLAAAKRTVSIEEVLGPKLVAFLGCLHDQPAGAAETALGALTHDSLMRLISLGIIRPVASLTDSGFEIAITREGWDMIGRLAARSPKGESQRRAAQAELDLARRERDARVSAPSAEPVSPWFERNQGLVVAVGIVLAAVVAILVAVVFGAS
jgi:hypothetical protein